MVISTFCRPTLLHLQAIQDGQALRQDVRDAQRARCWPPYGLQRRQAGQRRTNRHHATSIVSLPPLPSNASDCCALSLQPFKNPVAVIAETGAGEAPRADVFDLLNIVPYVRKYKTSECGLAIVDKRSGVGKAFGYGCFDQVELCEGEWGREWGSESLGLMSEL